MNCFRFFTPKTLFVTLFFFAAARIVFATPATTHFVDFGGTHGHYYSPGSLTFEIGDTIIFRGDFSIYSLESVAVPAGAQPFGPITTGSSFIYVVSIPGTYTYQNKLYASVGMKGSFTGIVLPHGSLTNEGREFYLGFLYPSYNKVSVATKDGTEVSALVTTFYDNVITVSYFDESGNEKPGAPIILPARTTSEIKLDTKIMRLDQSIETPLYKACKISSKKPVAVEYISSGLNSGGSYLALPVQSLGKKYVVASYNDNPGDGALYSPTFGGIYYPKNYENAGGEFMIIATEEATSVKITPNSTTTGGHVGAHSGTGSNGTPRPYSITLGKGECYLVRSDGKDVGQDISGSLVEATKPVAVISGHEDAFLGGVDGAMVEGRDLMIEQMVPVEFWDSTGYISVPFSEASPPGIDGHGDNYRIYSFEPGSTKVTADVIGISGGYQMSSSPLSFPIPEILNVLDPVDMYSTNGRKFSVMQYEERSQPAKGLFPAPSMMTIVPHSRWKKSFSFSGPIATSGSGVGTGATTNQFFIIISDSISGIKVSFNGGKETGLSAFSLDRSFNVVSSHYSSKAEVLRIGPGSYYLHSDQPFIVYRFGMREYDPNGWGFYKFESEYASPAGMQLNTGAVPSFKIEVTNSSPCGGWHICVADTGEIDPGIKSIVFIDDTLGNYYGRPGAKCRNISWDESSPDNVGGELHPILHSHNQYCFDVGIANPLLASDAYIGFIDNSGNGQIINLHHDPPAISFQTSPQSSSHPNNVSFPVQKIGTKVCTTFVLKNTGIPSSKPLSIISADFKFDDATFSIGTVSPSIPCSLKPGDSLTFDVCFEAQDSVQHRDTLIVSSNCIFEAIALNARSLTGLIEAENLNFDPIESGLSACKNLIIHNSGSAPYTLKNSFTLSDTVNFSLDPQSVHALPSMILPGKAVSLKICYHPVIIHDSLRHDTARIDWKTDLYSTFANDNKNYSVITGSVYKKPQVLVKETNLPEIFSIYPNPAEGNLLSVAFAPIQDEKSFLSIYDILGREVFHQAISIGSSTMEIPIRDLHPGSYYIRLISSNGTVGSKFEKQ